MFGRQQTTAALILVESIASGSRGSDSCSRSCKALCRLSSETFLRPGFAWMDAERLRSIRRRGSAGFWQGLNIVNPLRCEIVTIVANLAPPNLERADLPRVDRTYDSGLEETVLLLAGQAFTQCEFDNLGEFVRLETVIDELHDATECGKEVRTHLLVLSPTWLPSLSAIHGDSDCNGG